MERGGLVDWEEDRTGAPQTGQYGTATAQPETQTVGYAPADSAFDVWFQDQPFNREDVIVFSALVSVLILAYAELR